MRLTNSFQCSGCTSKPPMVSIATIRCHAVWLNVFFLLPVAMIFHLGCWSVMAGHLKKTYNLGMTKYIIFQKKKKDACVVRKKIMFSQKDFYLVVEPPHLKNMRSSNWIISPKNWGENLKKKWSFSFTTLVLFIAYLRYSVLESFKPTFLR